MSRIERSYKFCKFYDFSLNSTRYTKIRCLDDFSVRCAKIYDFMLIDQQALACGFYKIYDFSLPSQFLGSYDPYAIIGGVCLSAGIARSSGRNLVGLHDVSFRYSGHCCFEYM